MPAVSEVLQNLLKTRKGLPGRRWLPGALLVSAAILFAGCDKAPDLNENGEPQAIRVGYFPNVTHAQAVIGMARGDFQKTVGPDVDVVAQTFNAGPVVIEALYAGHLDLAYVGPSPALNGFIQSGGEEIRVIAGVARNGVSIVGNKERGITKMEQLNGARVATPQFANTQDISARYFLGVEMGFKIAGTGEGTRIIPAANPDIETLFAKNDIDAAWVPEPWASRLIHRGLATEIVQEKDLWPGGTFSMTCIVGRREFVEAHPKLVERFLAAHIRLTREIQTDPMVFADIINAEIHRITGRPLADEVLQGGLEKTQFSFEPHRESFVRYFDMGRAVGIYPNINFDVDRLLFPDPLEMALNTGDEPQKSYEASATSQTLSTEVQAP